MKIRVISFFLVLGSILFASTGEAAIAVDTLTPLIDSSVTKTVHAAEDSTKKTAIESSFPSTDRRVAPHIWDIVTNLPSDWRDWAVQNVQLKYWPQMALIAVSTTALVIYDRDLFNPFDKIYNNNITYQHTADVFSFMGDGKFQFGIAGVFAGYGFIAGDKRALRTAEQTCEVILACGGVVQLLKHVTGRESPCRATTPTGRWDLFPNQIDYANKTPAYDAFPSGHLATALATLTVVANNYAEQKWVKPVGYVVCAGIATGLVSQGIHWWSDFPLSIALGIGFGNLISPNPDGDVSVTDSPAKKDMGDNQSTIKKLLDQATLLPTYVPGGTGLALSVRF